MEKEIKLTKEEAQVLLNIINIAVKSLGMDVAESALFFTRKIQNAFKEEERVVELEK